MMLGKTHGKPDRIGPRRMGGCNLRTGTPLKPHAASVPHAVHPFDTCLEFAFNADLPARRIYRTHLVTLGKVSDVSC